MKWIFIDLVQAPKVNNPTRQMTTALDVRELSQATNLEKIGKLVKQEYPYRFP